MIYSTPPQTMSKVTIIASQQSFPICSPAVGHLLVANKDGRFWFSFSSKCANNDILNTGIFVYLLVLWSCSQPWLKPNNNITTKIKIFLFQPVVPTSWISHKHEGSSLDPNSQGLVHGASETSLLRENEFTFSGNSPTFCGLVGVFDVSPDFLPLSFSRFFHSH